MKLIRILFALACLITVVIYLFPRTWELNMIAGLQQSSSPQIVSFFKVISLSVFKTTISVGIPCILLYFSHARRMPSLRQKALVILLTLAVGGLFSYGIKKLVREARPYEVDNRISQWGEGGGYGFPSGHVLEAVAASTALIYFWTEWYVILPALLWILLMMCSRILLGVHDPGDVMGGASLGMLSFIIVQTIHTAYFQKKRSEDAP